jgi:hypothetical protein
MISYSVKRISTISRGEIDTMGLSEKEQKRYASHMMMGGWGRRDPEQNQAFHGVHRGRPGHWDCLSPSE